MAHRPQILLIIVLFFVCLLFRFSCICAAGWNGFNCTDDIDECESVPCMNNATCLDILNSFLCICLDGFTGKFDNNHLFTQNEICIVNGLLLQVPDTKRVIFIQ